ncbi:putative lea domain protein [Phaeomoniella chlamydospora]|uniref:Putative lea domain protein n=1 Tax=Phaeomoniella chlamydospora TaxID=158046 RepID=A0A0G2EFH8_PHACM|nr:putative lea domain protein [Phaeomoniella chlamydospora]
MPSGDEAKEFKPPKVVSKRAARHRAEKKLEQRAITEAAQQDHSENPRDGQIDADAQIAKQMSGIIQQHVEQIAPVCKDITSSIDRAERRPKDYLAEQQVISDVKPLIHKGSQILEECNGAIRNIDPDGSIAARAKERTKNGTASTEERILAGQLRDLTASVVKTVDDGKKRLKDKPDANEELDPLWALLTEPLFMILASVGLLLSGVLGLVGQLLSLVGLRGLVNAVLGGVGLSQLMEGIGLGSVTSALGLGRDGSKDKK